MRRLLLHSMWLISDHEKSARRIDFHPRLTVIVGENDTGKSSALKAIYETFGAIPAAINPKWKEARASHLVEFSVDEVRYFILKAGALYGVFDADRKLLWRGSSVTKELGPFLGQLLNFNLQLKSQQGDILTAPPAYCFLPFYVDQDAGWTAAWSSFQRLQMFRDYRKDAANFHSGIQPPAYYRAKGKLADAEKTITESKIERNALGKAATRLRSGRETLGVDLRPEHFGERVDALVAECGLYMRDAEKIRTRISNLASERATLIEQDRAAESAMAELDKDYRYALELNDNLICPTCGTEHESSFLNRFGLITDVQSCREFLIEVRAEVERIDRELVKEHSALLSLDVQASRIQGILEEQRGDVKLYDVLRSESERLVDEAIAHEEEDLEQKIAAALLDADGSREEMKALTDKKRGDKIRNYFRDEMQRSLSRLNVTLDEDEYKSIEGRISETGSDFPRALLAYYYSYLRTVEEFSSACTCPVVMDSPIQQDQDAINANRIIDFVVNAAPKSMQVILATVSAHGVAINGDVIELDDKNRLLQPEFYDEALKTVQPLYAQLLQ